MKKIFQHPLIKGSATIFVGSMLANIINYLFNVSLIRFHLFSPAQYGELAALVSVISIFSVIPNTITLVFSKFAASVIGKGEKNLIRVLFREGLLSVGVLSFIICLLLQIFSNTLGNFLHVSNPLLLNIAIIILFFTFLSSVSTGLLQGLLQFFALSWISTAGTLVKLIAGLFLVILGFGTFGATIGILLSSLFLFVAALIPLKSYITVKHTPTTHTMRLAIWKYSIPVFFSNLGISMFTAVDIILVKHFFTSTLAGEYAALSLIGRIIFYVIVPVQTAFFPLIAQKHQRNETAHGLVFTSLLLVSIPSLFMSAIYFIFPQVILAIFAPGKEYSHLASYLGLYSIFIFFFSLCSLLNNYFLSTGKTAIAYLIFIWSILEVIIIILLHQSILTIILGLILISSSLFLLLVIYYFISGKIKEKLLHVTGLAI